MLEEVAIGNWINGLHFFLDVTNYMPTVPNLWEKEIFNRQYANERKVKKSDVLLGYCVLFWTVVYLPYEKCLNSLLRRMRFPLMQRKRIIEAAWNCGFCVGSLCYLKSSMIKVLSFHSVYQQITYEELGVILHKSFYFHRAGIEILHNGVWIKGLTNLLFASVIMNPYQQNWCTVVSTLLFYKAIDTVMINACRILLCLSQFVGRRLPKSVFWLHALNWLYLYTLFLPKLMLYSEQADYTKPQFGLWLWFIAECLDSVWFRFVGCAKAKHWLEICLFPPPTQEAIQLASIQKKHRESLKSSKSKKTMRKTQMWQTLMCVMAIKNKVKQMRKEREGESLGSAYEPIDIINSSVSDGTSDDIEANDMLDSKHVNQAVIEEEESESGEASSTSDMSGRASPILKVDEQADIL